MKIILICSSGISSGLLVRRIKKLAEREGIEDFSITSTGFAAFRRNHDCDLALIAPIGPTNVNNMVDVCRQDHIDYLVIRKEDYESLNVEEILRQVVGSAN